MVTEPTNYTFKKWTDWSNKKLQLEKDVLPNINTLLMDRKIPKYFISVMLRWFHCCISAVR